jgi:TrmH family RNA methyltransferase
MKVNRYKYEENISYTLGLAVTLDLLINRPKAAEIIYTSPKLEKSEASERIFQLAKKNNIPVEENDKAFNILSPKSNCFVIGQFKKFSQPLDINNPHIVLVNPSDAGNVGTILRTAAGFGLGNVAIIRPAVDIFAPKDVRGSMGAFFAVSFEHFDSIEQYRKKFPNHNLYAFMLKASTILKNATIKMPYSLVFGNEATGLSDDFANFCEPLRIPHSKAIDSLSLPIAASIAMYSASVDNWND